MKKLFLVLLFCTAATFAQQKKYQGLLWEVSGNGLAKKSYLYGSMHVSDKVSYHLSDAFFTHLMDADIVANESDPATWNELIDLFSMDYGYGTDKFYSGFYMTPYDKANLENLFKNRSFTLNNILSRTSEYNKEYQEETYLDMFIYRTGRKYNKKTVGLEETKSSLLKAASADFSRSKPKEENKAALQKLLKNVSYRDALINFYREKDLDMLDSLTVLSSSEEYLKALLYDRNVVMVKSIDSLVRTGSLFAAVGAAHLPGKKGIIEMLRKKGYTVTPVHGQYTEKGKNRKEQIERYYTKPDYMQYTTADGMVSLPLYKMVIENGQDVQAPDLANGGYINIKRMLLNDYLTKDSRPFNHKSLDSLFYENIPGKILEKKFYTQDGYSVYDIKNITKTGNTQRYRYYISPLEIISISMAGEGTYTRQFENDIFNAITVKPINTEWKKTAPKKGGFSIDMPAYSIIYGETVKAKATKDVTIYGYDMAEKANYFVQEQTLKDNETLEDTDFELKRIQYEYYRQLGIDSVNTKLTQNPLGFTSSATLGSKTVRLKTVMHGAKYYLLGNVGASDAKTATFFNSFALEPQTLNEEYITHTDSLLGFSISVPKLQNERLDVMRIAAAAMLKADKQKGEDFDDVYRNFNFNMPSGQAVSVSYHKYARYSNTRIVDSLWSDVRKYFIGKYVPTEDRDYAIEESDYSEDMLYQMKNGMHASTWYKLLNTDAPETKIINEKISTHGDTHIFDGQAVKEGSEQAVKFRVLHRNGITYTINVLTPKGYNNDDPAIEKAFKSFTLLEDKTPHKNNDKFKLFIEDATSQHDSIREEAMASVSDLKLTKNDLPVVKSFLDNFSFKKEETFAQKKLLLLVGEVKDNSVLPLLEQQYKREGADAIVQLAILEALAAQENREAYKKILELLEYDLPVPQNEMAVKSLFTLFGLDTQNSAELFPDVLQFYSIPEYHDPLISFTAALLDDNAIKAKKLSSYKKMILTNARLEIKREKSRAANRRYGRFNNNAAGNLTDYAGLLFPFRKDKDVQPVLDAMKALENKNVKMELLRLDIVNNDADENDIKQLLADENSLFMTLNLIQDTKYAALAKGLSDESIAKSALVNFNSNNKEETTITFIEKKTIPAGKQDISFFFYRIKHKSENEYYMQPDDLVAMAFINNKNGRINPEAHKYISTEAISDEDELNNYMETIIDAQVNMNRPRAMFGKLGQDLLPDYLFDE